MGQCVWSQDINNFVYVPNLIASAKLVKIIDIFEET